ncbi:UNVERIFIED_CONTAM: hypothetical protein Sindi_2041500 [Sesamum indicum]
MHWQPWGNQREDPKGLLQPLPILEQAWSCTSMDFVERLPNSEGKDSIMVIVDRLTKYSHFIAIKHPYTAASIAKIFFDNIYKLHGLLVSIVSNRDKALYGYPPQQLSISPYLQSHHSDVEELMQERVKVLQLLKENLQQAQHHMKTYADKKRSEREIQVGDDVFLKLQPHKQTSVALRKRLKLSAKYYGPYKVIERVGKVAYSGLIHLQNKPLGKTITLLPRNSQILILGDKAKKKAGRSVALLNQNATPKVRCPIRKGNEDRMIQQTGEIGGGLKDPSKDGVVSGELGRDRGTIEIGDSKLITLT